MQEFKNYIVKIENNIATVAFNRPEKANSLHRESWIEMQAIFEMLDETPEARVIVLSGEGKHFCAGIDLALLMDIQQYNSIKCEGRKRELVRKFILILQDNISAIEKCRKPVLAAIHGACVGGAVDIISACDIRYGTKDCYFSIKEVDMGLVADIGTMQRLPKILNPGIMAEMAYTGRKVMGEEAEKIDLITRVYEDKESMMESVMEIAAQIASKSPLVIRGTKQIMQYTRDHSVSDSLNYMSVWNAGMLLNDDLMEAFQANIQKRKAEFAD